ncbi:MAG: D-erythronate dehydrogenase [Cyclobacteriaceae bacterium]
MRIIIFGGAGFLGKKLATELLRRDKISVASQTGQEVTKLVLFDKTKAHGLPEDPRLEILEGDICDPSSLQTILQKPADAIFHLAAIVSGEAEKDFELGMRVNLHATLNLLEFCRTLQQKPIFVFASSCAVFGGELSETIYDHTTPTPKSSYGTQKAMTDLLINDYSRRGFIDGRALRLPTIAIRPGKPNAATSSFVSSIIREPLVGKPANCPVAPETKVWILSPRRVTESFIHAMELNAADLGTNRVINLPGLTTSVADMVHHLDKIGGKEAANLIDWQPDPFIQSIVLTWPPHFVTQRGLDLGFKHDASVAEIIQSHIQEELS